MTSLALYAIVAAIVVAVVVCVAVVVARVPPAQDDSPPASRVALPARADELRHRAMHRPRAKKHVDVMTATLQGLRRDVGARMGQFFRFGKESRSPAARRAAALQDMRGNMRLQTPSDNAEAGLQAQMGAASLADLEARLLGGELDCVVVSRDTCPACAHMMRMLAEWGAPAPRGLRVVKLEALPVADRQRVRAVPLMMYRASGGLARHVGGVDAEAAEALMTRSGAEVDAAMAALDARAAQARAAAEGETARLMRSSPRMTVTDDADEALRLWREHDTCLFVIAALDCPPSRAMLRTLQQGVDDQEAPDTYIVALVSRGRSAPPAGVLLEVLKGQGLQGFPTFVGKRAGVLRRHTGGMASLRAMAATFEHGAAVE